MPTASASIAIEPRSGGAHRAWVVNPDTDTVSAFDLPSRSKLAEIAVGTEPRTVAVAPNGTVWVVNKRSESISVINASTFALQRTISLPRGCSPRHCDRLNGAAAYVALKPPDR
jgi:DNA-binding beta-propeller fold protein YncE